MEPSREFVEDTKRRATAGEAAAQSNLGLFYSFGKGVPRDANESIKWFRLAADQGDAQAQYNLGIAYDQGNGVSKSVAEAFRWFLRAALQGHSGAQFNTAICFGRGDGVAQDQIEFFKWAFLAALAGHDDAQKLDRDIRQQASVDEIRQAEHRASVWRPKAELPIDKQLRPGFYIDR